MNENLKRCPFCSSRDLTFQADAYTAYIKCEYCGATGRKYDIKMDQHGFFPESFREYKQILIDEWNHRPLENDMQSKFDALFDLCMIDEKTLNALEKATPKPIKIENRHGQCPECKRYVLVCFPNVPSNFRYCANCGQRFSFPQSIADQAEKEMQDLIKYVREKEKRYVRGKEKR